MNGAETFRIEESIRRILAAYGIESEVFAITNCLTVSIETHDGKPMTRMRRIGMHGNDLDGVERFTGLSRRICAERPAPEIAMQWLKETRANKRQYPLFISYIGYFISSLGFCMLFGGTVMDSFVLLPELAAEGYLDFGVYFSSLGMLFLFIAIGAFTIIRNALRNV